MALELHFQKSSARTALERYKELVRHSEGNVPLLVTCGFGMYTPRAGSNTRTFPDGFEVLERSEEHAELFADRVRKITLTVDGLSPYNTVLSVKPLGVVVYYQTPFVLPPLTRSL